MSAIGILATLRASARVWAIPAIHGEAARLAALHRQLGHYFVPGDQIVYLGNYSGHGPRVRETIDELLLFRRAVLALPEVSPDDIVFLRGGQEEMLRKLLQLQFAPNPQDVLSWMIAQGIAPTAAAYGLSVESGLTAAREGILALTRWTGQLAQGLRSLDGHNALMSVLRHAAYTEDESLLFVHAGVDPQRPLSEQGDSFWWGSAGFATMEGPFGRFQRVVRGYDRQHRGAQETPWTITLDAGCGFGGQLLAGCFAPGGALLDTLSA